MRLKAWCYGRISAVHCCRLLLSARPPRWIDVSRPVEPTPTKFAAGAFRAGTGRRTDVTCLSYRVSPLNTYGRRAFSVAGPTAWNSLPEFIRDPTNSTDCFRRLLKKYLLARYKCIQRIRDSQRLCCYPNPRTHSVS